MRARNIDEVVELLDALLARPEFGETHLGLFPALYRQVTLEVRQGTRQGVFEDNPRMERLDTIFANRYLQALSQWERGRRPSRSWEVAFNYARSGRGIALQHLLLGMNAHINLDLGVAAAEVSPGHEISDLKEDFDKINEILSALLDDTQAALGEFSPLLETLDRVGHEADERFADFSIQKARKSSWTTARSLAPIPQDLRSPVVELLDRGVRNLGTVITRPGPVFRAVLAEVEAAESKDIPALVARLNTLSDASTGKVTRGGKRRAPRR